MPDVDDAQLKLLMRQITPHGVLGLEATGSVRFAAARSSTAATAHGRWSERPTGRVDTQGLIEPDQFTRTGTKTF
jgi:hypothetical protein